MAKAERFRVTEQLRGVSIVDDVSDKAMYVPRSSVRALLEALAREAGAKEVIMNPRPGVPMRPVDGGPLIIKDGSKYLVIPLEESDE